MKVEIECLYCGNKKEDVIWSMSSVEHLRCGKCGDSNLKLRNLEVEKIDTYSKNPHKREKWKNKDYED